MIGPPFCITQDELVKMVEMLEMAVRTSLQQVR